MFSGNVVDSCIYKNKFFSVSPGAGYIVELAANNKVDDKDIIAEEAPEISFKNYQISKIAIPSGYFDKLDMNKKG